MTMRHRPSQDYLSLQMLARIQTMLDEEEKAAAATVRLCSFGVQSNAIGIYKYIKVYKWLGRAREAMHCEGDSRNYLQDDAKISMVNRIR